MDRADRDKSDQIERYTQMMTSEVTGNGSAGIGACATSEVD